MRRMILLATSLLCAAGIAACGSSAGGHDAGTPMAAALSYFPASTPFVATVSSAADGRSASQLKSLESSTPSATLLKAGAFQELAKLGIDYDSEIKPLLGNPIALGVGSTTVGAGRTQFLGAWQTKSASALDKLVHAIHALSRAGSHDGATLYAAPGYAVAVDGASLVIARNTPALDAALDRHANSSGFTAADYAADTRGLPSDAAVSVVGDLQTALSTPKAAAARNVPWVSALRGYGDTLSMSGHDVADSFRFDTTGHSLTSAQLPMAAGSQSPGVAGVLPIAFGLRDPAQVYAFVKSTLQTAAPARYQKLLREEASARARSGVDVDQLASSFTGDLQVTSDGHTTIGRVPVPTGKTTEVDALLAHPEGGETSTPIGGGLYRLTQADGSTSIAGIVHGELVAGKGTAAEIRGFAGAATTSVPGARGAIALKIDVGQLLALRGNPSDNPLLPRVEQLLGDLDGSAEITTSALTGSATLALNH